MSNSAGITDILSGHAISLYMCPALIFSSSGGNVYTAFGMVPPDDEQNSAGHM
jgi:hypothetical protein